MLSQNKLADWPGAVLGSIPSLQEPHLAYNPFREAAKCHSRTGFAITDCNPFSTEAVSSRGVCRNCKACCIRFEWNSSKAASSCISRDAQLARSSSKGSRRTQLQDFREDWKSLQKLRLFDVSQNSISVIPEH